MSYIFSDSVGFYLTLYAFSPDTFERQGNIHNSTSRRAYTFTLKKNNLLTVKQDPFSKKENS